MKTILLSVMADLPNSKKFEDFRIEIEILLEEYFKDKDYDLIEVEIV